MNGRLEFVAKADNLSVSLSKLVQEALHHLVSG
jgi:hypothetical protein